MNNDMKELLILGSILVIIVLSLYVGASIYRVVESNNPIECTTKELMNETI